MAIYTAKSSRFPAGGVGWGTQLITRHVEVPLSTAMIDNANDEVKILTMPAGAVLVFGVISASDMDTNGTPTLAFDVGDDGDEDRIFANAAVGQAGTLSAALATTGHGYKYTADTVIKAYVKTAAATAAAGTLKVTLMYVMDPDFAATTIDA
jgi:hypothetical protein